MNYRLLTLSVLVLSGSFYTSVSANSTSKAFFQVLPPECQYEIVADGSNTVLYLTPEACGQAPTPVIPPVLNGGQPVILTPTPTEPTKTTTHRTPIPRQLVTISPNTPDAQEYLAIPLIGIHSKDSSSATLDVHQAPKLPYQLAALTVVTTIIGTALWVSNVSLKLRRK